MLLGLALVSLLNPEQSVANVMDCVELSCHNRHDLGFNPKVVWAPCGKVRQKHANEMLSNR